jgi:hypothetical protein
MKKVLLVACSLLAIILISCSKSEGALKDDADLYQNVPSSVVPGELATGLWFSGTLSAISYYDRDGHELGGDYESGREYQFHNQNGKGRMKFWQYLGTRNSSNCVTEIYTRKEGSVVFEGDKFIFYPVKGSFKIIKKGCSSGNTTTERQAGADDLKPTTFRWDIHELNGVPHLYTFMETDVDHEDPVFVYQFAQ